jgi:hypothetical protein
MIAQWLQLLNSNNRIKVRELKASENFWYRKKSVLISITVDY